MALASLDIVAILKRELLSFGVPASTLASLAGISSGKLSSYLNEVTRCPNDHELRLRQAWTQLKRLIEKTKPLPLNFTKAGALRRSLDMMEAGTLVVVVSESIEFDPTEPGTSQE
jgi:hypothetical protein